MRRRGWLDDAEFAEVMGLGQVLPGPNMLNVAAILGDEWAGWRGAAVGVASIVLPPTAIGIGLESLLVRIAHDPVVVSAERAVVAAAAGLLIATGLRMLKTVRERRRPRLTAARIAVAALTCALACVPHVGIPFAVLAATPIAFGIELRAARALGGAA